MSKVMDLESDLSYVSKLNSDLRILLSDSKKGEYELTLLNSRLTEVARDLAAQIKDMQGEIDSLSENLHVCNLAVLEEEAKVKFLKGVTATQDTRILDLQVEISNLNIKVGGYSENIDFKDSYINGLIREGDVQSAKIEHLIKELSIQSNRNLVKVQQGQEHFCEKSSLEIELGYRNTELNSARKELARLRNVETDMEKISDAFIVIGSLLK